MHCVEAALYRIWPERRECSHRTVDPLKLLRSKVPQLEEITEKPERGICNHDHVWFGNALKPGCKVRCLANDGLLLRSAGADQVANDHQPGCDANPSLQGCMGLEAAHRSRQLQPC